MLPLKSLDPSQEFRNSLIAYSDVTFDHLKLPERLERQLRKTGLPLHSSYYVFAENPILFYQEPQPRYYALIKGAYLEIAEMAWTGKIAIDMASGCVWQIFERYFEASFMNSSIAQYVECLGTWLQFYPQFQKYVRDKLEADQQFSLFDHPEIYVPIRNKLSEIDPEAMKEDGSYWPRCCEPDIV